MSFETDFLELMPHTITVDPFSSEDAAGVPTYGTSRTVRCYIDDNQKRWRWEDGVERGPRRLIIVSDSAIDVKDRITMPVGFGLPTSSVPVTLFRRFDEEGYHHTEIEI